MRTQGGEGHQTVSAYGGGGTGGQSRQAGYGSSGGGNCNGPAWPALTRQGHLTPHYPQHRDNDTISRCDITINASHFVARVSVVAVLSWAADRSQSQHVAPCRIASRREAERRREGPKAAAPGGSGVQRQTRDEGSRHSDRRKTRQRHLNTSALPLSLPTQLTCCFVFSSSSSSVAATPTSLSPTPLAGAASLPPLRRRNLLASNAALAACNVVAIVPPPPPHHPSPRPGRHCPRPRSL